VNGTRRSLVAVMLALSLVLVACGKSNKSSTSKTSGSKSPSATSNDINPKTRDQIRDGGTFTWPISALPVNYNTNELDGTEKDTADIMSAMLPYPFDFDGKATPILKKAYFDSASVTATTPKQVVTYKINKKAKWSDGSAITEADFEAQWKAVNGTNDKFQVASSQGYDKIESVTKGSDDRTVVATFKEPYADWRAIFSLLLPKAANADPTTFNEGWKDKPGLTAGPFKLGAIDQTAKTVTLVRDSNWWGDKPKLDKIVFRAIDIDAQIDALANGEVDFIDVGPDVNKLTRAKSTPGVTVHTAGGPNFRHTTINGSGAILSDVNVRKAFALAVNRDTIAKALIGPLGINATPLQNHIFMANQTGYKNNAGELATADPEKAKATLDAAGWKLQGAVRVKNGKQLAIRMVIPANVSASKQEAELIQGMVSAVGFKFTIQTVPVADFFDKYITPGNFDVTDFSWIGTQFPISSSKSIYANPTKGDIQQNYARVGSPDIDALFDKATAELDPKKAIDIANEADAMIWSEVHSLTLYQRPELVATKNGLANFGAVGFATNIYENIGFTK